MKSPCSMRKKQEIMFSLNGNVMKNHHLFMRKLTISMANQLYFGGLTISMEKLPTFFHGKTNGMMGKVDFPNGQLSFSIFNSYGKSTCLMGTSPFSVAMLNYQRVQLIYIYIILYKLYNSQGMMEGKVDGL